MMINKAFGVVLAVVMIAAVEAGAQTPSAPEDRGFVTVGAGAQPPRRDFTTSSSFPVFDETATIRMNQHIGNGPMFDVNAGYRVWGRVALAVGFSSFSKTGGVTVNATMPDPLFFNRPKTLNVDVLDLQHTERAVYVQAMWSLPLTSRIAVSLAAGPSFIQVSQQLVTSATVSASQALSPVVEKQSKLATGVNVGGDLSYTIAPHFQPLIFVRFNGGQVNLPSVNALKIGGLQTGIGGRFTF